MDDVEKPSKSQKKREMHALQELGEVLVDLPHDAYKKLLLPEMLKDAVDLARKIHDFEGKRRQLQFIGKLMRKLDVQEIQQQVDASRGTSAEAVAFLHHVERWRDRLVKEDDALTALLQICEIAEVQLLRQLIRAARAEPSVKQAMAYRKIFRLVSLALKSVEHGDL